MRSRVHWLGAVSRLSLKQAALLVFVTALAARLLFSAGFQTWDFIDRWQFGQEIGRLGRWLAERGEFVVDPGTQTAKFPPVYPFIVAGVFRICGIYTTQSAMVLFAFQSICAGLSAICLLVLGTRVFNRTAGTLAGLGWAVYPSSLFQSTAVVWYSELSILLALVLIVVATAARATVPRFVLLGALAGLLILTDSSMLIYAALIPIWAMTTSRVSWRSAVWAAAAWTLAVAAVLSPWAIRNWKMFGSPGVLKSNFGMELFFGNNPYSSGGTLDSERRRALEALPADELARAKTGPESEYFSLLQRNATRWIADNPARFLKLTLIRFWNYWGKFPSEGPDRWRHYSWFHIVWYFPVVILAAMTVRKSAPWRGPVLPVVLFLFVYPLPYYLTHVQLYRYRYPVECFLVLLAAVPLAARLDARRLVRPVQAG